MKDPVDGYGENGLFLTLAYKRGEIFINVKVLDDLLKWEEISIGECFFWNCRDAWAWNTFGSYFYGNSIDIFP